MYWFGLVASLAKLVKAPNFGLGDWGFEFFKMLKIQDRWSNIWILDTYLYIIYIYDSVVNGYGYGYGNGYVNGYGYGYGNGYVNGYVSVSVSVSVSLSVTLSVSNWLLVIFIFIFILILIGNWVLVIGKSIDLVIDYSFGNW